MEPTLIELFTQLILAETGLLIRTQDYSNLCQKILIRVKALRLPDPQAYLKLLKSETAAGCQEWKRLIPLITTIESYFFRDQGQINLLQTVILPELIASRQSTKQLKLWSAGCSTGEEPYSLSILLQRLLPDWKDWNIVILGTDVNEEALNKARQGVYSAWSFRMVDPDLRGQYFWNQGQDWKINSQTQNSVQFFNLNLVKDSYQFPNYQAIQDIDLIICRNVFVYFDKDYISLVMKKFYDSLKIGGYLITGHAELQSQDYSERFQAKVFPESIIYQKPYYPWLGQQLLKTQQSSLVNPNYADPITNLLTASLRSIPPISNPTVRNPLPLPPSPSNPLLPSQSSYPPFPSDKGQVLKQQLEEAKQSFKNKQYKTAIQKLEKTFKTYPNHFEINYLLAQCYANLGQYESAKLYCQKALEINSLSKLPYYLLLQIAQEREDLDDAKLLSKRIIYLDPTSIPAYLELASIYEQEGDQSRAKKMYRTALELLKGLPSQTLIEHWVNVTAGDLITFLKNKF